MNIYIGNLNYNIDEDELRKIFGEYGEIVSVKIITDRETGRTKGFAFVEMQDEEDAKRAISELNGKEVMGRNIKVNFANKGKTEKRNFRKYK